VLLATNIEIDYSLNIIAWNDSVRERRFVFNNLEFKNEIINFTRNDPTFKYIYNLYPITLEIYKKYIKNNLINSKDYSSIEQLQTDLNNPTIY
jgi:hypothetical protein